MMRPLSVSADVQEQKKWMSCEVLLRAGVGPSGGVPPAAEKGELVSGDGGRGGISTRPGGEVMCTYNSSHSSISNMKFLVSTSCGKKTISCY